MKSYLKVLAAVTIAAGILGTTSLAEAGKIRSTVERRQSQGKGFWDTTHKPIVRHHYHRTHGQLWNSFRSLHHNKTYRSAPKSKKSWGWQRSSRAELHHPGPRKRR